MTKVRMSFKNKVLIPLILVFSVSTMIISWSFYNSLESSVRDATNAELDIFTESIMRQAIRLEMILALATESLAQNHLAIGRVVAYTLDQEGADLSTEALIQITESLGIQELNIADTEGTIIASNFYEFIGFNFGRYEITSIYLPLADGTISELQELPRLSVVVRPPIGELSLYTGIRRAAGGFYQFGFYAGVLLELQEEVNIERAIGEAILSHNGYGFVMYNGTVIAHPTAYMLGLDASEKDWFSAVTTGNGFVSLDINGTRYYAGFRNEGSYTVIGLIPEAGYYGNLNQAFYNAVIFFVLALVALIACVYILINRLLRPIKTVTDGLGEIAKGNLDARITGDYNDEFALIKDAANKMAADLTAYLEDKLQAERHAHETEVARLDLKDFIASMTHDIKTPLSVLSLNLEALSTLAYTENNPEYHRRTRVAYQKCQDLQRLIQNLFEANSIERGRITYSFKNVSLLQLLAESRGRYDDYLEDKGISLEISALDDDSEIYIDQQRIWSVFDNIIYNAARYTPKGGSITISGKNNQGTTVITITDTGSGIPAENLPHIFEKFYKMSQSRGENDGDSGLGLYIVKNIMEGHRGSVKAVSTVNEGTTIILGFCADAYM